MPSYVVTGASRGLGYEFISQLSSNPENTVIALVRNKAAAEEKVTKELPGRKNLHILKADLVDFASLKDAAIETAKITGGSLDVLIGNAALVSDYSAYDPIGELATKPEALEKDLLDSFIINVVGNIHLNNLFTPLLLKGTIKKAISLSTGMADIDFIAKYEIDVAAPYAISKAGLNAAVAKFHAQYAKDGVLFMAISPGFVDTGNFEKVSEEKLKKLGGLAAKFATYASHFKGPSKVEDSVKDVLGVIENATIEKNGGLMVSHLGTTQWL